MQLRIKGTISQISLHNIKTDISGACLSPVYIEDTQARFIKLCLLEWHDSPATGLTVMANNDVDGGAAPDITARGRELFERPSGRGVGAAGANDRAGAARWAAAQDRTPFSICCAPAALDESEPESRLLKKSLVFGNEA